MAEEIRRMRQKGGTTAQWETANPTLALYEIGYEWTGDAWLMKLGDGATAWNDLEYYNFMSKSLDLNNAPTGAYELVASDNGKLVIIDDALTIPTGLPVKFNCTVWLDAVTAKALVVAGITTKGNDVNTNISSQGIITLGIIAVDTALIAGEMEP